MVYNQPSKVGGQITTVDVFAAKTGRRLKLGIYRPEGTKSCLFRLVQEYIVDSVPVGRSTVTEHSITIHCCDVIMCDVICCVYLQIVIPEAFRLVIKVGDHFGFTWLDLSVVVYEKVATDNFCEQNVRSMTLLL